MRDPRKKAGWFGTTLRAAFALLVFSCFAFVGLGEDAPAQDLPAPPWLAMFLDGDESDPNQSRALQSFPQQHLADSASDPALHPNGLSWCRVLSWGVMPPQYLPLASGLTRAPPLS